MANRRMFSIDVVGSDKFLDLPISAQCLYFHLGMRADDDGFISSPKQIMKMIACSPGDMKILAESGYIIPFESGIIVIRHWKQHNYIQKDRYRRTKYTDEVNRIVLTDNVYMLDTEIEQGGYNLDTQVRLGKDRVRDSIELGNTLSPEPDRSAPNTSGILLPLNDRTFYDVPTDKIATWQQAYPAVDVEQQLKRMIAWLESNPNRRKTRRGINAFINTWLSREQDKGGTYRKGPGQQGQKETAVSYELPPEYQEMYKDLGGKDYVPEPDDPFQ